MPYAIFQVVRCSPVWWLARWSLLAVLWAPLTGCPDGSNTFQGSKQCGSETAQTCTPPALIGQLLKSVELDSAGAVQEHYYGVGSEVREDHGAYLVEINKRGIPNAEIWVLAEPLSTPQQASGRAICRMPNGLGTAACRDIPVDPDPMGGDISTLSQLSPAVRAQALVQINGFTFDGTNPANIGSLPTTRVYESTYEVSPYRLATSGSGAYDSPEYVMAFNPRDAFTGVSARLVAPSASCVQLGLYNAFGDTWPLMVNSECLCDPAAPGTGIHPGQPLGNDTTAFSVIGYSANAVVMLIAFPPYNSARNVCALLSQHQVTDAVLLDSGDSAGMLLNSPTAFKGRANGVTTIGRRDHQASYHLALVSLDGGGHLQNADFEAPRVNPRDGRQPITASDSPSYREFKWTVGGVPLDGIGPNLWIYTHLDESSPTPSPERPVNSGNQAVALRPGNYMSQSLALPNDRYCMLHFYHGYNMANPSCAQSGSPSESALEVAANQEHPSIARFHAPANGPLQEAWLRIVTAPSGPTEIKLTALTNNPDPLRSGVTDTDPYEANCEVLIDNVRLECAGALTGLRPGQIQTTQAK